MLNKFPQSGMHRGLRLANSLKKETLVQLLSCEFCEISKNTFLHRAPLVAASVSIFFGKIIVVFKNCLPSYKLFDITFCIN